MSDLIIQMLSQKNLDEVWEFLKYYEKTSIALFSHLIENNKAIMPKEHFHYYLIYEKNNTLKTKKNLLAVFMISKSGLIFHQFANNLSIIEKSNVDAIEKIFKDKTIYSIVGQKEGTEFFQTIIEKAKKMPARAEFMYHYLIYDDVQKKILEQNGIRKREFPSEYQQYLKWNEISDLDALAPLQAIYDKQEVIPPFKDFDAALSKANLKRLLLSQKILSMYKDAQFIAKAGSNAQGLKWVQIGGVCTKTKERNRGYAQFLVQNLVQYFRETENKELALFVKENNESAKKAYQNLGFVFDSYFKIVYY